MPGSASNFSFDESGRESETTRAIHFALVRYGSSVSRSRSSFDLGVGERPRRNRRRHSCPRAPISERKRKGPTPESRANSRFPWKGDPPPFFFSLGQIPTQIELWNFRFCRNPMFGQTIVFDPLFMIVTRNSKKGSISLPSINLRSK